MILFLNTYRKNEVKCCCFSSGTGLKTIAAFRTSYLDGSLFSGYPDILLALGTFKVTVGPKIFYLFPLNTKPFFDRIPVEKELLVLGVPFLKIFRKTAVISQNN